MLNRKNRPDGIFSVSDIVAVGAIRCANKMGVNIPNDLAIIGFNDDPIASIIDPGLSSITHPAVKMGQTSAEKILNHLTDSKSNDITEITFLNTEVIVRGSSMKKKASVSK